MNLPRPARAENADRCDTEPTDLSEATAQQVYLAHAGDGPHCRPLLAALAFVSSDDE